MASRVHTGPAAAAADRLGMHAFAARPGRQKRLDWAQENKTAAPQLALFAWDQ